MSNDKGPGDSLVILLVEDNASHVEIILRAFAARPRWARLQVVRCLQEAQEALATTGPDLVLVDGVLPDGHGLDLLLGEAGTVLADPTQMHQMLINLCTNAEYAMRQTGGFLEVRLHTVHIDKPFAGWHTNLQAGAYVCIMVRDTGHGIAPD